MLTVVFENEHGESECDALLVGVQDAEGFPVARYFPEVDVEVPKINPQQVQDGLPPENGIVVLAAEIEHPAESEEPRGLLPVKPHPEILPHVKEKIGSYLAQAAHDIQKYTPVDFEKGHGEIGTDIVNRHQLQRKNGNQIVFSYCTTDGKHLYHGCTARAHPAESLFEVRFVFACGKGRNIGIYVKIISHLIFV